MAGLTKEEIERLERAANVALKSGDELALSIVLTRLSNAGVEWEFQIKEIDDEQE